MTRTEWEEFLDLTGHFYTIAEGLPLKDDDDRYTETLGRLRSCEPPGPADINQRYEDFDAGFEQGFIDGGLPLEKLSVHSHKRERFKQYLEDGGITALDVEPWTQELLKLRAWKAEAVAFLKADVNCDCETGYLCSRCALLVE